MQGFLTCFFEFLIPSIGVNVVFSLNMIILVCLYETAYYERTTGSNLSNTMKWIFIKLKIKMRQLVQTAIR